MAVEPQEISLDQYNERVAAWGTATGVKIRARIRMLTSKGKGALLRSLRLKTAKWFGEIDKLSYHFERHGVFVHKGVGRGYGLWNGKIMHYRGDLSITKMKRDPKYAKRKYESNVPAGAVLKRQPKEWFNPIMADNIVKLADMVAEMRADTVVNATKTLIR